MMAFRRVYILFSLLFSSAIILPGNEAAAQKSQAKATSDTARILIGDHVNIFLELNQPKSSSFLFPVFRDTIIEKVEVLSVSPIDTLELDDRLKLRQHIVVTSFDTGFYVIPPFLFLDNLNGDSLTSNALPLEVLTMEIDTAKGIADIKLPYDVALGFWEIAPYIFTGLLLLAIGLFLWFYYRKKRMSPEPLPVRVKPVEPAHIWALRELDQLSREKLWQKGKVKLYHSKLTDIIRTYLEYRFDIKAMEYTTSETIEACSDLQEIREENLSNLQSFLELADLVKFAKWNPLPDENEKSQQIAYDFVLKTKLSPSLRKTDTENSGISEGSRKEGENV